MISYRNGWSIWDINKRNNLKPAFSLALFLKVENEI